MEELNTPMNGWFSDLEMEDYDLFPPYHYLNLLDDEESSALQHPLCSESYSYHPTNTAITLTNSSTNETSYERPTKLVKTDAKSTSLKLNSPKPSPSPSPSPSSKILSFDNSMSLSSPANTTLQFDGFDLNLNPKQKKVGNLKFSARISKEENQKTKNPHQGDTKRSPSNAQDHILAERKRREKLSQGFIALAALLPGLDKMDKASVLANAIMYVKELQERFRLLEQQSKKSAAVSVVVVNNDLSSSDDTFYGATESLPHVEARVSQMEVLLRIHCPKQRGLLVKLLNHIQSLHLFLVSSSVLPFGDSILGITIVAKMGEGYNLTTKDLVRNISGATLKLIEGGANLVSEI